jgi:hypothetical protein
MKHAVPHGRLERALRTLARRTRTAQLGLADLEARLYRRELASTRVGAPVYVAGLPRGGTTMLLRVLAGCPEFAAHLGRDFPFVLCPLLWQAWTRPFQRPRAPRERVHGDGILVTPDSPEALEEVLWTTFWPNHYGATSIAPWPSCDDPEFGAFYAAHRRKIVLLRARSDSRAHRYLAKNNAHLARLPALWSLLPDATVVVPFRAPLAHAASLLRMHRHFSALQQRDPAARRGMADLGHFEFGLDLRPIDFAGWLGGRSRTQAHELEFWLEYWCAAHRHVLALTDDPRLVLVDFDALAAQRDMTRLAQRLGITDVPALQRAAVALQPPPDHAESAAEVPAALREPAAALHRELRRVAGS